MTAVPNLGFDFLDEGGTGLELEANDALLLLDAAAGGFEFIDFELNTPPGSPSVGDTYVIGTTPTGDWSGQAGNIAVRSNTSWIIIAPYTGAMGWIRDENLWVAYAETAWHLMQGAWTTAEWWTGKQRGGSNIYTKIIDFGALPNNTSKSVAHGISSPNLAYDDAPIIVEASLTNGNKLETLISAVSWDGTNVTITTTADQSAISAYLRVEYTR